MAKINEFNIIAGWKENNENRIGKCRILSARGSEIISFEYNPDWLRANPSLILDPSVFQTTGIQYPGIDNESFGFLSDIAPDRWGRKLIERREEILAKEESRPKRTLMFSDYLIGVSDYTRQGGIRIENGKEFLSQSRDSDVPPVENIRSIENASIELEKGNKDVSDWIKLIVAPGSSLGGARPKANIKETDGSLWIAKFPSVNDDFDIAAWEMVAHDLASMCGISVPEARIVKLSKYGNTFLVKRFDRKNVGVEEQRRIHYASAMTMLGEKDGGQSRSYLDLVEVIEKICGNNLEKDLKELWYRLILNVCISNTDDHLRNHGFLLNQDNSWSLSPAFDINPNPNKNNLSLNIDFSSGEKDLSSVLKIHDYFRITDEDAKRDIYRIAEIVNNNWRPIAKKYGISKSEQLRMENCFELAQHIKMP
ncbi:MAG: type II toxin-antitoxin system HipA family toxin [Lachnospiraceae bacterium]|nr:type II toxin-antitoxin system HipA family toxin [Lachnospiraceae bacterium]